MSIARFFRGFAGMLFALYLIGVVTAATVYYIGVNNVIDAQGGKITNLSTPSASSDAATKSYVDSKGSGTYYLRYQNFTANGTFTVPENVTRVVVTICGGGGGGGGGYNAGVCGVANLTGGGGGGGGACVLRWHVNVVPGESIAVTIGNGGNGGAVGVAGTAGQSSLFGKYINVNGGSYGNEGRSTSGGSGGDGGSLSGLLAGAGGSYAEGGNSTMLVYGCGGSGGGGGSRYTSSQLAKNGGRALNYIGGTGYAGAYGNGGGGGSSCRGRGASGVASAAGQNATANTGGGGSGGFCKTIGGNGGSGLALIEWFG